MIKKINLKKKTGYDYAGIDTFKDNYLLVTYDEYNQVLVLDHTQPDLQPLINISPNIQPFEYRGCKDYDCCVISEERNQLFIADRKNSRV